MPENVEYRKDSLPPMKAMIIHKKGSQLAMTVHAIGYGMTKPSIELSQSHSTAGGRIRTEYISISGSVYDEFMEYLLKADKHWGIERK